MAVGSVSSASQSTWYRGVASGQSANEAALARLGAQADERAQLEVLTRHMFALKDALAEVRENWRRSDQRLPPAPGTATSLAVLAGPAEAGTPLAELAAFAGVAAGTLTVNGTAVAFDPAADSLQDLIDRINGAGAGVTATLDDAGERLVLTADGTGADLALEDGGAGLLEALGIAAGTHASSPSTRSPGMSWTRARTVAEALADAVAEVNVLFAGDLPGGEPSSTLVRARADLQKAVESAWKADSTDLARDVGLRQDFEAENGDPLEFTRQAERALVRALRTRPASAETMLFGPDREAKAGLVGKLELAVAYIEKRLETTYDRRGMNFDLYA